MGHSPSSQTPGAASGPGAARRSRHTRPRVRRCAGDVLNAPTRWALPSPLSFGGPRPEPSSDTAAAAIGPRARPSDAHAKLGHCPRPHGQGQQGSDEAPPSHGAARCSRTTGHSLTTAPGPSCPESPGPALGLSGSRPCVSFASLGRTRGAQQITAAVLREETPSALGRWLWPRPVGPASLAPRPLGTLCSWPPPRTPGPKVASLPGHHLGSTRSAG